MTRAGLAEMLERFVGDAPDCGDWEWDDFTSVKAEPAVEPFRQRLLSLDPASDQGAIREVISELRA